MRWQPLLPWWAIVACLALGLAAIGWRLVQLRRKGKQLLLTWLLRACLVLVLALMAFGPSIPRSTSSPGIANLDVIFAVDTTSSMAALDYTGAQSRLTGVKHDLLALSSKLNGAHLELITFDSKADLAVPFTSDNTTFTGAVQTMNVEIYGAAKGSAIDKPIDLITQQLKNSKTAHPERNRILFYIGDGEQTATTPVKSFGSLADYLNGGAVLGYGTTTGAKMLRNNGLANPDPATASASAYVTTLDPVSKVFVPAISKLDENALKKIANELGMVYQNRNQGGSVNSLLQTSKIQLAVDHSKRVVTYLNLYWLLAIPFALLLFWEWQKILILLIELHTEQEVHHV